METQQLQGFVLLLVLVGMVLGVGILIVDKFGDSVYSTQTITNESVTWPNNNTNITLAKGNVTSITQILNASGTVLSSANYSLQDNGIGLGKILAQQNTSICITGASCKVTYVYNDYTGSANTALYAMRNAISQIATSWFTLIVTIGILSFLLVLVVRSFGGVAR